MLRFENVSKTFNIGTLDETKIFENLNFEVKKGEFVSVIGSNGSGKSTLLNLICGSILPENGNIFINGKNVNSIPEYKRFAFIGRVYQNTASGTCESLTVLENLALADNKNKPFSLAKAINKKRINTYRELLSQCSMGLENRLDAKVSTLSGGQRQALALIIANMADISLLVLDEHTAALDPKSSDTVMQLTERIVKEKNLTTVMVTHNLRFAASYGTRLIMLHDGQFITDIKGEDKKNVNVDKLLDKFYEISVEKGN